nr:iron-sulfur cluster assembly scaffold protein [Armatimonas sp.]
MYSVVASEHFHAPRRVGPLEGATHTGTAGTPGGGPYVVLWFVVSGERIDRAAYKTFGCPAAIASASMVAELVEGRLVEAALMLTESELIQALGGLPEGKEHCPKLAVQALVAAFQ